MDGLARGKNKLPWQDLFMNNEMVRYMQYVQLVRQPKTHYCHGFVF